MDPIEHIPLSAIDADALPRDRSDLDPAALLELRTSINDTGLRQPIEVWKLSAPRGDHLYGLISGMRRLTAYRELHALRPSAWPTIPAFVRTVTSIPDAMAAMVTENEIRAGISPWDKGRLLVEAVEEGIFSTCDDAAKALYPALSKQRRYDLRTFAAVVEEFFGKFRTPEELTHAQLRRLASAMREGFIPLMHQILKEQMGQSLEVQWKALLPTLCEAERNDPETPATSRSPARPRRLLELRQGLVIRREMNSDGWALRFSGEEARKGALLDDVMDYVERTFQPGYKS